MERERIPSDLLIFCMVSMTTMMRLNWYLLSALILISHGIYARNPLNSPVSPAFIFETLALNRDIPTQAFPKYRSPTALVPSPDGRFLYVAEQTAKRITVVDILLKKVCKIITVPNEVTGIAVTPGGKLYVTCSSDQWPEGIVCEINPVAGKVLRHFQGGSGARSPIISPDGKLLYICNQYGNNVQIIDIARGEPVRELCNFHQPFSASVTPDGSVLVVADCLPFGKSTDEKNAAAKISLINTSEQRIDTIISLPVGSHSIFDVTVSPDGKFAFVSHLVGMFTIQAAKIEGGWIHTNNLAVIDLSKKKLLNDFPLDDPELGSANPWEISCTSDGTLLCVAHAGSNDLSVIDIDKMLQIAKSRSAEITFERGLKFTGCSHDLQALSSVKYRISVTGKGPRAVAIIGRLAFTAGYFGDSTGGDFVEIFDIGSFKTGAKQAGRISLGPPIVLTGERKGERAFYDGTLAHQKWQSCSSCHPSARADGLNWILGQDAAATIKNAKSMVYSWWTPPTQWSGKRSNAAESIRLGFRNSLFTKTDNSLAAYIDTFLMRIRPVPSPYLIKGKLSNSAVKGKDVYFNNRYSDCITCHRAPLYTDMSFHTISIPLRWDLSAKWDTPTIVETWRDSPYGHLGSFDRVEDIMKYDGHSLCIKNGLSEKDFRDLVEYILSL